MSDFYYYNVSLLLHCDGTNGSTTFTDNSPSPKTVTANGNAQISTAQSKWGGSSGLFDGTGDYLSVPNNAAFNLSSGDFTIEVWAYITSLTTGSQVIINKDGVAGVSYPQYGMQVSSAGMLNLSVGSGNGVSSIQSLSGTTAITTGTWHHLAVTKSGTTLRGFLDGSQEFSATQTASMIDGGKPLLIGWEQDQPASHYLNGYIDDIRITRGIARYTSNFAPPTAAFDDFGPPPLVPGIISFYTPDRQHAGLIQQAALHNILL